MGSRSVFAAVGVVFALVLVGCESSDGRSVGARTPTTMRAGHGATTTGAPVGTTEPVTTTSAPTALDQLAPFVTAARTLDGQLRAAATAINGAGPPWHTIPASVTNAVNAAATGPAEHALPAGMPASVAQPALLVLSDLESRSASLKDFGRSYEATILDEPMQQRLRANLGFGAVAANDFAADLAALEAAARSTPAFTPAAADSRAGAELAVLEYYVVLENNGCDAHGGARMTTLPRIVWQPGTMPDGTSSDGTIATLPFSATWTNGAWSVVIFAC
ncbi:MAG TPA: hypothetical protein VFC99_00960 [Acidimicrobiia bacterium]|nr:hypothetical protein [Acidimicrobiia bacterium]